MKNFNWKDRKLIISTLNLIFFGFVIFVIYNMRLFGLVKGYAPHEITLSMYVIPSFLVIKTLAVIIFIKTLRQRKKYQNKLNFYLPVLFSLPIILNLIFTIIKIIMAFIS